MTSLLGSAARAGLTWFSRRSLPQIDGSLKLNGLSAPVEVIRDRWGIPHIYAQTETDLCFAQGYVHAQDRLWQMELNRRTGQGRLSELFGDLALDTDRAIRTFGFNRLGREDWLNACDDIRTTVEAYTAGVNAFLSAPGRRLPVEFNLLRYKPAPWEPLDTMDFVRVMIWQLSHAWYGEIVRAQIIEKVGEEHAAELAIEIPANNPIALPKGIEFHRLDPDGALVNSSGPFLDQGKGSNAWTVSSSRSATGRPFLCNDMHLTLSMPSLWYEVHLEGGGLQVSGVSLPGVPLVLVGHNARLAWGMTLAFTDCEDLYVERFNPQQPDRYLFQGEWLQAEKIEEPIRIKGRDEPVIEYVTVTRHGPVISDVVGVLDQKLAVRSMALQPGPMFEGWLRLNQAHNWDKFVEAMGLIEAPQLNVAYADVDGNIGYWVTGRVPIRAKGNGEVPAPGWTGEYEWTGEVPFQAMPHALNPEQGYTISCNNKIVPDDYPYFLGNVWMNGYRSRRLDDVFQHVDHLSPEEFADLHVDFTSLPGLEFVHSLDGFSSPDPDVNLGLELLRDWNGILDAGSPGGCLYEVARFRAVRNLLEPGLGEKLATSLMGEGFHPLLMHSHELYGHDTTTLLRLLDKPDSWWLQQAGGKQSLLEKSLKEGVVFLKKELGSDPRNWTWGQLHHVNFNHPLAAQPPLGEVFNRGPFPIGGDTDTVCQTAMLPGQPYDNNAWAPSWRMIVDLGDLSKSLAIFPPGQSGQIGSPHYDDLIEPWLTGRYHPMLWERDQVEREAEGRLILEPLNL